MGKETDRRALEVLSLSRPPMSATLLPPPSPKYPL